MNDLDLAELAAKSKGVYHLKQYGFHGIILMNSDEVGESRAILQNLKVLSECCLNSTLRETVNVPCQACDGIGKQHIRIWKKMDHISWIQI